MDINEHNFWSVLPAVIRAISEAAFVSVDVEMTGIKPRNAPKLPELEVEDAYQRAKEAAQTFQTLQVGLTCIRYNNETNGKLIYSLYSLPSIIFGRIKAAELSLLASPLPPIGYDTQSFNFYISPMFIETDRLGRLLAKVLDRTVSFSYSSLLFLQSHGFLFREAFNNGVPYLSRQELAEAADLFLQNPDAQLPDEAIADIASDGREAKEFYALVREKVRSWLNTGDEDSVRRQYPIFLLSFLVVLISLHL